jgi:hypothetical protein
MPLIDQIREEKLIELAKTRFSPDLLDAELKVLHDSARSEDLPDPGEKAPRPVVRPDFLRWLATDPEAAQYIDSTGLRVYDVIIPGKLDLYRCHVNSILNFRRCDFQGEINLQYAEIRGFFSVDSSLAEGICAGGVIVHRQFYLWRTHSEGEIRLPGADVKGILVFNGAKLKAKGDSLNASTAKIGGSIYLIKDTERGVDFESDGAIRLIGVEIRGDLICSGAKLKAEGRALSTDGAKIVGSVFLNDGFDSKGEIHLCGAEIGGTLSIRGAKVANVVCHNTVVMGDMAWQRIEKSWNTTLNLIGARVKNLRDDKVSWPEEGNLDLDGLVYEELTLHGNSSKEDIKASRYTRELQLVAKERIDWIMLQRPERRTEPQPWMQLRDLLERKGERKQAKYVLRRFRCLQAQKSWIPWRWVKKLYALLEEAPLRIGWSIALTLLIGTSVFTWGGSKQAMIETVRYQPNAITDAGQVKLISPLYPKYQPFVYTLENAVPLIKLGMDEKWAPNPSPEFRQPWFPHLPWLYFVSTYGWLNFWRWALIVGGWVQATVLAASVADRFRK